MELSLKKVNDDVLKAKKRSMHKRTFHEVMGQKNDKDAEKVVEETSVKKPRTEAKTHSNFLQLCRSLTNAEEVAAYIDEHHNTKLRDLKQFNSFFQAISNCSEDLFDSLCQHHRREVHLALERMLELFSSGKVMMSPPAHEFVIRCEQNGVRKAEWAVELHTDNSPSASPMTVTATTATSVQPLLSPRELLKKLALVDPRGRLERMIEMCFSVEDLYACARKLQAAAKSDKIFGYAVKCQLISKLVSKARRTCGTALLPEPPHLSADDNTALSNMMGILLNVTEEALSTRPPSTSQQSISKLTRFAKWCEGYGLLDAKHATAVASLEEQAMRDLKSQTTQLETVMMLKALAPGDEAAAREAVDSIWNNTKGHFEPYSADVLSSIAVVASGSGMSDAFRTHVVERLVKTYRQCLHASGGKFPRRVLKLLNAEHSREKQESIKRMLAAEEEKTKKT